MARVQRTDERVQQATEPVLGAQELAVVQHTAARASENSTKTTHGQKLQSISLHRANIWNPFGPYRDGKGKEIAYLLTTVSQS
jgi:hypothetical protein